MFEIYKSSAGSGKTYTLAMKYISYALAEPEYFRRILAVTFTNKATKEMKERIMEFLKELSGPEPDKHKLAMIKELHPDWDEADIQRRAKECLSIMLHRYSWLSVKTIDSFFQQVLRSFTRELGLRGDFELELNSAKVEEAAIDALLQDVGSDQWLTQWLLDFVMDRIENDKSYHIEYAIKELSGELHKERITPFLASLAKIAEDPVALVNYREKLLKELTEIESKVKSLGQDAMNAIHGEGLGVDDFVHKGSGVAGQLQKWAEGQFTNLHASQRSLNAREGSWATKTSPKLGDIQELVDTFLQEHLEEMFAFCDRSHKRYLSLLAIRKYIFVLGILLKLMKKITEYKQAEDVMLLADTPPLIKQIIGDNEAPYIYEKVGMTFYHYLIDEFQDTSGLQWENMRPLVLNSLANADLGSSVKSRGMVVGDVKQSIYRWRGGDWQLLLNQIEHDLKPYQVKQEPLNTNWRSLREIVDFNNELYAALPGRLEGLIKGLVGEKGMIIHEAYAGAKQEVSPKALKKPEGGLVKLSFLSDTEEDESEEKQKWKEKVPDLLLEILQELRDKGYKLSDIAILTRTNWEGNELIRFLQHHAAGLPSEERRHFDVVSKEALAIKDAPVVQCLIRAMAFLQNPDDPLLMVSLASVYARLHHPDSELPLQQLEETKAQIPSFLLEERDHLRSQSLYQLCETLITRLELKKEGQIAYLQAFEDAILNFQQQQVADLPGFLAWWEEQGAGKSVIISDDTEAIQVLSIHKSKGLQFPVVILPYLDWQLDNSSGFNRLNLLWTDKAEDGLLDISVNGEKMVLPVPLSYSAGLADTHFSEAYRVERVQTAMDALNMLYVATTRTERVLYGFAPKPKENKNGDFTIKSIGHLLFENLKAGDTTYWRNEEIWESGELPLPKDKDKKKAEKDNSSIALDQFYTEDWQNRLRIKSRHHRLRYTQGAVGRLAYGNLFHDLMEHVRIEADFNSGLDRMQFEGRITEGDKESLNQIWQNMLENPQIKSWFTGAYEVRNETPILSPAGEVQRPDRVMIDGNRAVIVDYKTGKPAAYYAQQLNQYRKLLIEMGFADVKAFLLYTDTLTLEEVKP